DASVATAGGHAKELAPRLKRLKTLWIAAGLLMSVATAIIIVWEATPPPSIEELHSRVAAATSEYRCASLDYAVGPDRSVRLSGFAATPGDIDHLRSAVSRIGGISRVKFEVGLRIWPYCEVVALLQPLVNRTPSPAPSLALVPPD